MVVVTVVVEGNNGNVVKEVEGKENIEEARKKWIVEKQEVGREDLVWNPWDHYPDDWSK